MLVSLLIAGCTAPSVLTPRPTDQLLIAVEITETAFSGPVHGKSGFFLYLDDTLGGPIVTAYEFRGGRVVDRTGGGSYESDEFLRAMDDIRFESFDYDAEIAEAAAEITRKEKEGAERVLPPFVLDGSEYKIEVRYRGSVVRLQKWNPGAEIDFFASHSTKIAKLKAVIDLAARYYGRSKFGV